MWFFLGFIRSACDTLKIDSTGQHHFLVIQGSEYCLAVPKPKTVIIFDAFGEAKGRVCINKDDDCVDVGEISMFNSTYNISGIWFGDSTGEIHISSPSIITTKFVYAIMPDVCDKILITNQRNYSFKLTNNDLQDSKGFCFFDAAYGTYNYKVQYNIDEDDALHIKRNDNVPRTYRNNNRFSGTSVADDPALFYIDSSNQKLNSSINLSVICDDIIPDTNITRYITDFNYTFLRGEFVNDFPPPEVDDKFSNILSITLLVVFAGCGIGCIIYRVVSYYRKKKLREQRALERANAPKKKYRKILRNKMHKTSTKQFRDEDFTDVPENSNPLLDQQ